MVAHDDLLLLWFPYSPLYVFRLSLDTIEWEKLNEPLSPTPPRLVARLGSVSDIACRTTTPERNVTPPMTPIAHSTPKKSASTPASSAPSAYPLSRQSR